MSDRTIVLWTIAACMSAIPVAAQAPAPTTTAFDGTYAGVSRTFESHMYDNTTRGCMPLNSQPGPLTIADSAVRWQRRVGTFEGSVNGQGALILHGPLGQK
jgi:hypothetical protein